MQITNQQLRDLKYICDNSCFYPVKFDASLASIIDEWQTGDDAEYEEGDLDSLVELIENNHGYTFEVECLRHAYSDFGYGDYKFTFIAPKGKQTTFEEAISPAGGWYYPEEEYKIK